MSRLHKSFLGAAACRLGVVSLAVLSLTPTAPAADPAEFFETRVRPVLAENCFACHTSTKMGGLEMKSREALVHGGNSGPAIVPGAPGDSLLVRAIRHEHERLKMPPTGKLEPEQIAAIAKWIEEGAVWPETRAGTTQPGGKFVITPEHRRFWAFQPVRKPALPTVKNKRWARTPIDRFVLARLEAKGLRPVKPAEKRTLLRRAYLDLIGLPPTPEEVEAFLEDDSPDSFAQVVDRLLASPHYGERWGRYWLDVARYSDDKLNSTQMEPYPHAYRYRDWVIRAFNEDMPYDLFLKAQVAGDQLEGPENGELVAGLAFYGLSPQFQDDRIDATMRGFQAMTAGCAQCHDHKFDPIPTEDYYSLLGIFNSTKIDEHPLAPDEVVQEYQRRKEEAEAREAVLNEFLETQRKQLVDVLAAQTSSYLRAAWAILGIERQPVEEVAEKKSLDQETLERWVKYLGSTPREQPLLEPWDRLLRQDGDETEVRRVADEIQELVVSVIREKKEVDEENKIRLGGDGATRKLNEVEMRSLERDRFFLWRDIASNFEFEQPTEFESGLLYFANEKMDRFLGGVWKAHVGRLRAEVRALQNAMPPKYPFLHVISDIEKPRNERVHIRGNKNNLGGEVPRRFLSILSDGRPFTKGSGRLELAEAIASPDNPLTARVMVNRVWLHHFGRGIVGTPSNFGQMGERPTHPALLDYLAVQFIESGWSIKALHREIMLSSTYALSAAHSAKNHEIDPDNRQLWRANRRRLDVEALRDALLAVSGNLDATMGGEPLEITAPENRRRTVYAFVSRRRLDTTLGLFDFPNPNKTSPRRIGTNTPLQGLFLLNSELVLRQAERLADRLEEADGDDTAKITAAYRLLFGRKPGPEEVRLGRRFVKSEPNAWPRYTQALLSSNEFVYVD